MSAKKIIRFSAGEKTIFSKIYHQHKFELGMGKDRVSREKNDEVWAQIAEEFNSHPDIISEREPFQLKKLLANNKQLLEASVQDEKGPQKSKQPKEDSVDTAEAETSDASSKTKTSEALFKTDTSEAETSGASSKAFSKAETSKVSLPASSPQKNDAHSDDANNYALAPSARDTAAVNTKRPFIKNDGGGDTLTEHEGDEEVKAKRLRVLSDTVRTPELPGKKAQIENCDMSEEELKKLRLRRIMEQDAELAQARLVHENSIAFIALKHEEEVSKLKLKHARELFAIERRTAIVKLKTQRIAQDRLIKMGVEDLLG